MLKYTKLVATLTSGALLGCTQFSMLATQDEPADLSPGQRLSAAQRIEPLERVSSPVSDIERQFLLGRSAQGAGQLALAEAHYGMVLDKNPAHSGALNALAVLYAQTDRFDKAIDFFRRALALAPQASHLHNNLGYALLLAGQLNEAQTELELALDMNPSSSLTQQNLALLEQSRARAGVPAVQSAREAVSAAVATGPDVVAIAPNVYELRDPPSAKAGAKAAAGTHAQPLVQAQAAAGVPVALRGARIEVSNGVGIRHLARRTAERLAPLGLVTARLTNQAGYQQPKTELQFGAGQKSVADALSAHLPTAVKVVAGKSLGRGVQMRLVLGHDQASKAIAVWLDTPAEPLIALEPGTGWLWG